MGVLLANPVPNQTGSFVSGSFAGYFGKLFEAFQELPARAF